MTTDAYVFSAVIAATSFGVGYLVGENHAETVQLIQPAKPTSPCLTAPQVKKLYYTYGVEMRKIRKETR